MVGAIEPRLGVEVYISEAGRICISQAWPMEEDHVVMLHEDEARELISLIQSALTQLSE